MSSSTIFAFCALLALSAAMPGGRFSNDVESADTKAAFDAATKLIDASYNSDLVRYYDLISSQSQVVSGTNYVFNYQMQVSSCHRDEVRTCVMLHAFKCEATLYQALDGSYQLLENKCTEPQAQMFGGKTEESVDDKKVKEVANMVFEEVEKEFGDDFVRQYNLLEAESQLVKGINYFFKYNVEQTDCHKASVASLEQPTCNVTAVFECNATVYKSLDGATTVMANECDFTKVGMGGRTEEDVNDADIKSVGQLAFRSVDGSFDSKLTRKYRLVRVESQVVSGTNYFVDFAVELLGCKKDSEKHCDLAKREECNAVVYENFAGEREVVSATCLQSP